MGWGANRRRLLRVGPFPRIGVSGNIPTWVFTRQTRSRSTRAPFCCRPPSIPNKEGRQDGSQAYNQALNAWVQAGPGSVTRKPAAPVKCELLDLTVSILMTPIVLLAAFPDLLKHPFPFSSYLPSVLV